MSSSPTPVLVDLLVSAGVLAVMLYLWVRVALVDIERTARQGAITSADEDSSW